MVEKVAVRYMEVYAIKNLTLDNTPRYIIEAALMPNGAISLHENDLDLLDAEISASLQEEYTSVYALLDALSKHYRTVSLKVHV